MSFESEKKLIPTHPTFPIHLLSFILIGIILFWTKKNGLYLTVVYLLLVACLIWANFLYLKKCLEKSPLQGVWKSSLWWFFIYSLPPLCFMEGFRRFFINLDPLGFVFWFLGFATLLFAIRKTNMLLILLGEETYSVKELSEKSWTWGQKEPVNPNSSEQNSSDPF